MRRIGILGGTFDPPHIGHLIIAEEVRIALQLEEIWFIPTHVPPHKQSTITSSKDRLNMLKCATADNPAFKVKDLEMNRSGKSYTYDTMAILKKENEQTDFYFIIGGDMVEYLPHWHRIDDLLKLVTFVGIKRNTFQLETDYPIIEIDVPIIDVSATFIRDRLKQKKSVNYFIQPSVYSYIKKERLYEPR